MAPDWLKHMSVHEALWNHIPRSAEQSRNRITNRVFERQNFARSDYLKNDPEIRPSQEEEKICTFEKLYSSAVYRNIKPFENKGPSCTPISQQGGRAQNEFMKLSSFMTGKVNRSFFAEKALSLYSFTAETASWLWWKDYIMNTENLSSQSESCLLYARWWTLEKMKRLASRRDEYSQPATVAQTIRISNSFGQEKKYKLDNYLPKVDFCTDGTFNTTENGITAKFHLK